MTWLSKTYTVRKGKAYSDKNMEMPPIDQQSINIMHELLFRSLFVEFPYHPGNNLISNSVCPVCFGFVLLYGVQFFCL
jgi:hypothetical protein